MLVIVAGPVGPTGSTGLPGATGPRGPPGNVISVTHYATLQLNSSCIMHYQLSTCLALISLSSNNTRPRKFKFNRKFNYNTVIGDAILRSKSQKLST